MFNKLVRLGILDDKPASEKNDKQRIVIFTDKFRAFAIQFLESYEGAKDTDTLVAKYGPHEERLLIVMDEIENFSGPSMTEDDRLHFVRMAEFVLHFFEMMLKVEERAISFKHVNYTYLDDKVLKNHE